MKTLEKAPSPAKTSSSPLSTSSLALLGGTPTVTEAPGDLFTWPIITKEDEEAALEILRHGAMSSIDETMKFEKEFAAWEGVPYALGFNNGTGALLAAMFACGVGVGDEIICPATTYWASGLPCFSLGATIVFADIDPETLCIDPAGIERHISDRTKAIVAVHYLGHPCDMDPILEIARRHKIKVIEDVSHAHGGRYKGKKVGTLGDAAGYSLMSGKSLVAGEGGMMTTAGREIYQRALAFGHYERFGDNIDLPELVPFRGLPMGGYKNRMHGVSAAVGRVQLKHYDRRETEIRRAMNYFWDLLKGVPGVRAHRVDESTGSTMGGWYAAHGLYRKEELGGLSLMRFCEAVQAEGVPQCVAGCNLPLHLHPLFNDADIYHHGKPTRIANSKRDLRQKEGSLPVAEGMVDKSYFIPWFKHYRPAAIEKYAAAFRKVAEHAEELRAGDEGKPVAGVWNMFKSGR